VFLSPVGLSNLVLSTHLCLAVIWDSGQKYFERKFTTHIHPSLVTVSGLHSFAHKSSETIT